MKALKAVEWVSKQHSISINGDDIYQWDVWKDCGMIPYTLKEGLGLLIELVGVQGPGRSSSK